MSPCSPGSSSPWSDLADNLSSRLRKRLALSPGAKLRLISNQRHQCIVMPVLSCLAPSPPRLTWPDLQCFLGLTQQVPRPTPLASVGPSGHYRAGSCTHSAVSPPVDRCQKRRSKDEVGAADDDGIDPADDLGERLQVPHELRGSVRRGVATRVRADQVLRRIRTSTRSILGLSHAGWPTEWASNPAAK